MMMDVFLRLNPGSRRTQWAAGDSVNILGELKSILSLSTTTMPKVSEWLQIWIIVVKALGQKWPCSSLVTHFNSNHRIIVWFVCQPVYCGHCLDKNHTRDIPSQYLSTIATRSAPCPPHSHTMAGPISRNLSMIKIIQNFGPIQG